MDINTDLYGMIVEIIKQETMLLRHYIAKVIDNQGVKGEITVTIAEWGESPNMSFLAFPREKNIQIPKVGDYVEVYFVNGEANRPVYFGICNELQNQIVKGYDGNPKTNVIFEDRNNPENSIVLDSDKGELVFLKGVEPMLLGTKFKTWIENFITSVYNAHVHTGVTVGAGSTGTVATPATNPTDIYSEKIKGK